MVSRESALVGVIMGSKSDWEHMASAAEVMDELKVPHEIRILSAHRTPDLTMEYAAGAAARGLKVIIAGAGGAAHLAGSKRLVAVRQSALLNAVRHHSLSSSGTGPWARRGCRDVPFGHGGD